MKNEKGLSFKDLSFYLGFRSANTTFNYVSKKSIPKNRYEYLDHVLKKEGY